MNFLRAAGRFCYDLVIGDDWKIAAAVVTALGVAIALTPAVETRWRTPLVALLLAAAFTTAIFIDTRKGS